MAARHTVIQTVIYTRHSCLLPSLSVKKNENWSVFAKVRYKNIADFFSDTA